MRSFDWSATPLGPPEVWGPTLQVMTRLLLSNSSPILLWWGPDFIQLYNDACIPVLGKKHPHAALGKPFRECWSEVYPVLGPLAEIPYNGGPPTWIEDIPLELNRFGFQEEAHFTISCSPVPDAVAPRGIGGVLAIVHEISTKIVGDRRLMALRDLGAARSAGTRTAEEACADAARRLATFRKDVPFALIYLLDEKRKVAHLSGKAGVEDGRTLSPQFVDVRNESAVWPFGLCIKREEIVVVDDLAERFDRLPPGPWSNPPTAAAVVPIKSNITRQLAGFLVVGISSRLRFDDAYRGFLELASAQIGITIANARAYELERKRAEALAEIDRAKTTFFSNISHDLRQSEVRFRALVAASSDVIYQMTPDWSAMRQMEGRHFISDSVSPDRSWLERYIHPDDRQKVKAAVEEAIRTRGTFELEHRVLRGNGSVGWTFSRAIPLMNAENEITEWFGTATDITARKQAEEALLRSERLASIGRMAATISHEINNPFEAVTNLLFLATKTSGVPNFARECLEAADTELKRVAHMTRQALGFYRESTAPAPTNLNKLVESTVELLKGKINAKQIAIEREWDNQHEITAVEGELRQVFSNLLVNSVEAIERKGVIRMRISQCTRRGNQRGIRITIADNGKGIDLATRSHIFEPLYTTKGAVGTGLGLWVSKQIIEKHRGRIQIRSSSKGPHKGSTFSVVLPI